MNNKRIVVLLSSMLILFGWLFVDSTTAKASSPIVGTFVKAEYDDIEVDKDTVKKVLSKVVLKNDAGRTITLAIDHYAKLSIDTVPVKIEAFKLGMEVEADVQLRRVKTLSGITTTPAAVIEINSKSMIGVVSSIHSNQRDLSIILDDGRVKNLYINASTKIFKSGKLTDIASLYEGDRINAKFSEYNSNVISQLDIMDTGVQVAGLYKGTLQRIDPISKKVIIKDETKFLNWHWYSSKSNSHSSYTYSANTPIYLDNQPVPPNQLRKYANHKVYLATVNKHGKEQVERMIIQKNGERTYYEQLIDFNSSTKHLQLADAGDFTYHNGSILIRNGRLVAPEVLGAYGTAFVASAGPANQQIANIVHISNDGLDRPNASDYKIYFGEIGNVNSYQLQLVAPLQLTNNVWSNSSSSLVDLHFTNETYAVEDSPGSYTLKEMLIPQTDLRDGKYGYFYVKNDQLIATHLVDSYLPTNTVSVGRLATMSSSSSSGFPTTSTIDVRNVSRWIGSRWTTQALIYRMDINQTTFIKDGQVIQPQNLQINDRLFILSDNTIKGRLILVD